MEGMDLGSKEFILECEADAGEVCLVASCASRAGVVDTESFMSVVLS